MKETGGVDSQVRRARADDLDRCLEIIRALPDHFTDDVPDSVRRDLGVHDGWVILAAGAVVGFVVVDRRAPRAAEILWIAVEPTRRNAGLGSRLLDQALAELRDQGVALVEVKTLDRSADYEPYEATHAFYERNGFVQIDSIEELPGWPPGNPAAIYVAALETTSGRAGEPSFFSLGVEDAERGRAFYGALFGWQMEPGPSGAGFAATTTGVPGGIHGGDAQASPYLFFRVDDLDAALELVCELGGTVDEADHVDDAEDESAARFGRFRLCRDDQGSTFGLHQPPGH